MRLHLRSMKLNEVSMTLTKYYITTVASVLYNTIGLVPMYQEPAARVHQRNHPWVFTEPVLYVLHGYLPISDLWPCETHPWWT